MGFGRIVEPGEATNREGNLLNQMWTNLEVSKPEMISVLCKTWNRRRASF